MPPISSVCATECQHMQRLSTVLQSKTLVAGLKICFWRESHKGEFKAPSFLSVVGWSIGRGSALYRSLGKANKGMAFA